MKDLTLAQTAALAEMPLRDLRNEVDRGVIATRRGVGARRVAPETVLYLLVARGLPLLIPRQERSGLFRALTNQKRAHGWERKGDALRNGSVTIRIGPARRVFHARLRLLDRANRRVVVDPAILGGEPVFAGTRMSVRHIGLRALAGETTVAIRADHPVLTDDDVAMAALLARIGPGPGRPRKFRLRRSAT